jgi:putative addiction module component (TIGR02574 family)
MTKLLEDAIAQARELPEDEQDQIAEALFAHMAGAEFRLTDDQVEEVRRRQQELREGKTHFATDDEMDALWKKCEL